MSCDKTPIMSGWHISETRLTVFGLYLSFQILPDQIWWPGSPGLQTILQFGLNIV